MDSVQINTVYTLHHRTDYSQYIFLLGKFYDAKFGFDSGVSQKDLNGGIVFTKIDTSEIISGYFLDESTLPGFEVVKNDTLHSDNYFQIHISGGFYAYPYK